VVKQRKLIVSGAVILAAALALTACGGDSSGGTGATGGDPTNTNPVTIYSTKPENPLVPGNTNENGGSNVIQAMFRGLVKYNPDTAAPEMAMAESIDSPDETVWTVKLKPGQTFQDGTPVTSDSFIKAWNWVAYGPNAAVNNYFYAPIKGYDAMNPQDPDGDGPKKAPDPTAKELSGLKKVSDSEFVVTLSTPQSVFPVEVGYTAFAPLPDAFFADPAAFGKKPIGNGPFAYESGDGDTGFVLKKWDGYKGTDAAKVSKIMFKTYTSPDAAYSDLVAGNLDFMDQVPPADLVNDQYLKDLDGRGKSKALGYVSNLTVPSYDKNFQDPNLNKALSLAIDRAGINKSIYNNGREDATGWVSPIVDGYKAGACGEFCTYDPVKAKEYFAKAKFKGPFTYATNFDGQGNKEAADAICNSIHKALNVTCTPKSYVDFGTYRTDVDAHKMTGMFRTAWAMDYPSIQNFLEPLYVTGASSNDGLYSNPAFDALIKKADAESGAAALATYQQAEALLKDDMAVIPLWYVAQQYGYSARLSNVKVTPTAFLDVSDVTVK
jgi:oligopeptide transport system substrate-binding protein